MVLPTVLAVLAFQTYWLLSTYREQRRTVASQAKDALLRVYDQSFMENLVMQQMKKSGHSQKDSAGMIDDEITFSSTIISTDSLSPHISMVKDSHSTITSRENIQPLLSSILSSTPGMRPDIKTLATAYKKELTERGIDMPVQLSYINSSVKIDTTGFYVCVPMSVFAKDNQIYARFSGVDSYLFKKMSGPVIVSVVLLLIVAGCIWIMWRIILRQKALEIMRSDFISNITHELKTPVAILSTINEALLTYNGIDDKAKTERYLRLSKDELNKLHAHIEEILTLSKMENGMPLAENNKVLLQEVFNIVAQRYSHLSGVHIATQVKVDEAMINTHRESLLTILNSLVDNSIKYADKPEKRVELYVTQQGENYLFSVADNGIGISEEHLPFIFDKFYRVPQGDLHDVKGYGLGLSHVKELVSRLGGSIKVSSTPGSGSLFTFKIPGT